MLDNVETVPVEAVGGSVSNVYKNVGPVIIAGEVGGNVSAKTYISYINEDHKPDAIWFGFNYPDPNFTGRLHELNLLKDATISHQNIPGHKPPIVVVSGLGGIGKTQLVRKFIDQNRSSYNNVIWINSEERTSILVAFSEVAKKYLKLSNDFNGKDEDFKVFIEQVFNKLSTASTVIVFDNVDKIENKEIIRIVLTLGTSGIRPHVVITSRIQEWSNSIHLIKLNGFTAKEGLAYVTTKLPDPKNVHNDTFKDKMALVEKLQYFPLALAQSVAHINNQRVDDGFHINDYLQQYESSLKETILDSKIFQEDELSLYEQTTMTTWKVTIAAINKCEANGDLALRILQIIAYFDPEHIRRDIFFNLKFSEQESDIKTKVKSAVRLLVNYSMVDSHTLQSVLMVHRLVQQVTKIELERKSDSKKNVLRDGLHLISEMELNEDFKECIDHGTSVFIAALTCEELIHEYNAFPAMILEKLNDYGKYIRALTFGVEIAKPLTTIIGDNDPEALKCFSNTANSHFYMGNYSEALRLHQIVLQKQLTIFEEKDPSVLVSLSNIANIYNKIGEYSEALRMHKDVFESRKTVLGEYHPHTLHSLSNIAITYYDLGNYSEALKIQQEDYEKRKTHLGEDHPHTLDSMSCIAVALMELGNHPEAQQMHQAVFEMRKTVSGEDHPQTLLSLWNVAITSYNLGKYAEAQGMYQSLYDQRKKVLGEGHPDTLKCKFSIAKTYFNMGEYAEALTTFQELYEIQKKFFGADHRDTLESMSYVAYLYNKLGEHSMALEIEKKVFEKQQTVSGENHPETFKSMSHIALTYNRLGKHDEALRMYQSVYEKRKTVGGEDHTDTLDSMFNIAITHDILDDYAEALRIFQSLFKIQMKVLGEDHPDTLRSMYNISRMYFNLNERAEAVRIYQSLYEIQKKVLGEDHPDTLGSMSSIQAMTKL